MSLNNLNFSRHPSFALPDNHAAQSVNPPQNDLLSTTQIWAVDEVNAMIAHQLNEPLTALLLYLHEIKDDHERSADSESNLKTRPDIIERALYETERLCKIMERIGNGFEAPLEANAAFAARRAAIVNRCERGSMKGVNAHVLATGPYRQQLLTNRELEVLALITEGATSKVGGHALGISSRTFEVHRAHIMAKLGTRNIAELVRLALGEGR